MRQKSELRSYQQRVINHLYENDEALAILKMGAGKTVATLTAIEELLFDGVIRHALIVAPKRVATLVWPDEITAWAHTAKLTYAVLDGPPAYRLTQLKAAGFRDLTIIGIDNLQWLVTELEKLHPASHIFDCLVIDETSRLKDPTSKRGKALNRIVDKFKIKWGLTGTPRPNSLLDLFTPVKLITSGRLWGKSFYKWQKQYFYPADYKGYSWLPHAGAEEKLLSDVATISIALGEGDMPELPELSILVDEVMLDNVSRETYDAMQAKLFAQVDQEPILAASTAVATGKLAQIANGFIYDRDGVAGTHRLHETKAEWLEELVAGVEGEPLIIVYEYQEDLAMVRRLFGNIPYLGSGVSDKDAKTAVDDWNAGRLPLFALHPASGGHGLNLQHGGSRMAWVSPCWSAEYWDQTIARIHRPGQGAHVMIHVCVATDTVDEMKRMRVISKLDAQAAFEAYLARVQVKSAA